MNWEIFWEAIGAFGEWFAALATAYGIYIGLEKKKPKLKISVDMVDIFSNEGSQRKYQLHVKNVHDLPVTIEEIGVIIRNPLLKNPKWNNLTGNYFTWGKQYLPLSRYMKVEYKSLDLSVGNEEIVKFPVRLEQEKSTAKFFIDFRELSYVLKFKYDVCVIQFYFRDVRDRIYSSEREFVEIPTLEKPVTLQGILPSFINKSETEKTKDQRNSRP